MAVMGMAAQHTFKALTKRPEIAARYYASRTEEWARQHSVLLGGERIAGEVIRRAMHRLWLAAVRFLSYEPALDPVDIRSFLDLNKNRRRIDWVIAGGESGPSARPAHPDWFRFIRDQCAAAGIPFFFKQHGAWVATEFLKGDAERARDRARFVNSVGEFVAGSGERVVRVARVGKPAGGAVLDGEEHRERP
jgi:protein gp37